MECYIHKGRQATKKIRDVNLCIECYLLALEHCADFTFDIPFSREGPLNPNLEKRLKECKERKER